MTKKPVKLTCNKYENAISMGAGLLIDFEGFRLIEGTDGNMKIRYLVLASKDGSPIKEYDPDTVECIEV